LAFCQIGLEEELMEIEGIMKAAFLYVKGRHIIQVEGMKETQSMMGMVLHQIDQGLGLQPNAELLRKNWDWMMWPVTEIDTSMILLEESSRTICCTELAGNS
jgi:hypothetical protein